MDPQEQKTNHSYPNADRSIGGGDVMPRSTNNAKDNGINSATGGTTDGTIERPLVHISDAISAQEALGNEEKPFKASTVHTFKDDMQSEASKGNFSIGKIMMANSKKAHDGSNSSTNLGEKKSHAAPIITLIIICVLIVGAFSYVGLKSAKTPEEIAALNNPTQIVSGGILYSEQSLQIDLTNKNRTGLYNELNTEISTAKIPVGKIKSIVFTYQAGSSTLPILASDFMKIVGASAPDILLRNIKDQYVFGYYSYNSNEPFIILRAANYDSVFAGMLEWEKSIYADLGDLIQKKESLTIEPASNESAVGTTTEATTTASPTTASSTKPSPSITPTATVIKTEYDTPFVDRVISNIDTRVLYRPNGNIALFYTFFNKDTVIIAVSEQSLREIIYRLTSGKITR